MDRISSTPAIVAQALHLIAAPACACDASGLVVAANTEMALLAGESPLGRSLLELFRGEAAELASAELAAAVTGVRCWRSALSVHGEVRAVEVCAKPLPAGVFRKPWSSATESASVASTRPASMSRKISSCLA